MYGKASFDHIEPALFGTVGSPAAGEFGIGVFDDVETFDLRHIEVVDKTDMAAVIGSDAAGGEGGG